MCVIKIHAFIYFLRPPPWYGTVCECSDWLCDVKKSSYWLTVRKRWSSDKLCKARYFLSCDLLFELASITPMSSNWLCEMQAPSYWLVLKQESSHWPGESHNLGCELCLNDSWMSHTRHEGAYILVSITVLQQSRVGTRHSKSFSIINQIVL